LNPTVGSRPAEPALAGFAVVAAAIDSNLWLHTLMHTKYFGAANRETATNEESVTGTEFAKWRERTGLTQGAAATRLGVTRTTIQNWESGATGVPTVVNTACQLWERRLKQENPRFGPVTLVYTDGPMFVSPYGRRGPLAMMQQEALPTNAAALGRVLELWGEPSFNSPLIMEETHDILWNAVELRRVAHGEDAGAPTPARWRASVIREVAEYLRKTSIRFPVRNGARPATPAEADAWRARAQALIAELDHLADEAAEGAVPRQEVEQVLAAARAHTLCPTQALASAVAQAFA
jgi:DNA-binding transcriptional regulator YiaG